MVSVRKMKKEESDILYSIAMRAFKPDYERYGMYPPLLNTKKGKFMPPLIFGKTILKDGSIIGGAFVLGFGKKGEVGSIFLDPDFQGNGYGKEAMLIFEQIYPGVKEWKLETPALSYGLHKFYGSLGYVKTGEIEDKKSGFRGFVMKKTIV
ncbi:MAG: GNAT family N-acetyltransferase [Eubacteriaceae bacterium]|nr:GNAT family N-acetyltransferase [Eubacteriaceae bacterium]